MLKRLLTVVLGLSGYLCAADSKEGSEKPTPQTDPATGMIIAEHWEITRNHCIICHSPQQFLRQKGTRLTWTEIVKWMQESAGLWKLDPVVEDQIITYLAENYAPSGSYRRAPIPATLLPKNPYRSEIAIQVDEKRKAGLIPESGPVEP